MNDKYTEIYGNLYSNDERKNLTSKKLLELRQESGLTQKEVSELLGISQQTYNTYERGRTAPTIEMLVRFSYLYEVPIDFIVDKSNFNKDERQQQRTLEAYSEQLRELKEKLKNSSDEEKEKITQFIEGMEKMLNALQ